MERPLFLFLRDSDTKFNFRHCSILKRVEAGDKDRLFQNNVNHSWNAGIN